MHRFYLLLIALSLPGYGESVTDYFDVMEEAPEEMISTGPDEIPRSLIFGPELFDLQEMEQDFVLETKRIEIPGFPDAFNPSIIQWDGSLLLSFRIYGAKRSTHGIGLIRLDQDCNILGEPQILSIPFEDDYCHMKRQDPRLIELGGHLYMVYNNHLKTVTDREIRRMFAAEIQFDGEQFFVEKSDIFLNFEGEMLTRTEKNWVPFEYDGSLLFAYSINPHRILRPIFGTSNCESVATSQITTDWNWGALRGGSPALRIGDEYLAFFHSSKNLPTVHSKGKTMLHYFMGAYTFSAEPPFAITRMSPGPLVGAHFYDGPAYKTWKPLRVVFPSGYVMLGDTIWLSYGKQDHEVWVAKIDKTRLLDSLIPVH